MSSIRSLILASTALALSTACTDVTSSDLLTSGMYADMTAVSMGEGTTELTAILRAGGALSNTYVELAAGDELVADLDGEQKTLGHTQLGAIHAYSTTYPVDAADSEFHVAFNRTVDAGAPDSVMTMPEPFAFASPGDFSRAAELTITWEPSGTNDAMQVAIVGPCVFDVDEAITADTGTHTFAADAIQKSNADAEDSCDVTITLQRRRDGTFDPAFGEGGWVRGVQRRVVTVTSNP